MDAIHKATRAIKKKAIAIQSNNHANNRRFYKTKVNGNIKTQYFAKDYTDKRKRSIPLNNG